jgi:hypothetical protein
MVCVRRGPGVLYAEVWFGRKWLYPFLSRCSAGTQGKGVKGVCCNL